MADLDLWLAGLTTGQPVAVLTTWSIEAQVALATITRVTATRVVVDGVHFWRTTVHAGQQVGGRSEIRPLDDPEVVLARQRRVFRDVDVQIDRLFKQARDGGLTQARMIDTLFQARGALLDAMGAMGALMTGEALPGAAEPHDDTTEEETDGRTD